jgi:hypothetical protein
MINRDAARISPSVDLKIAGFVKAAAEAAPWSVKGEEAAHQGDGDNAGGLSPP